MFIVAISITSCSLQDETIESTDSINYETIEKAKETVEKFKVDSVSYSYFYKGAYCYLVNNNTTKVEKKFYLDHNIDILVCSILCIITGFWIGFIIFYKVY